MNLHDFYSLCLQGFYIGYSRLIPISFLGLEITLFKIPSYSISILSKII